MKSCWLKVVLGIGPDITLRPPDDNIARKASDWNPLGTQSVDRPRMTWKRIVDKKARTVKEQLLEAHKEPCTITTICAVLFAPSWSRIKIMMMKVIHSI